MKSRCNSKIFLSVFLITLLSSCGSEVSESSNEFITNQKNSKPDSTEPMLQTVTTQSVSIEDTKKSKEEELHDNTSLVNNKEKSVKANVTLNWPWRGITIVSHAQDNISSKDIDKLASYGVNLIRLRLSFREIMKREKIDFETAKILINEYRKNVERTD